VYRCTAVHTVGYIRVDDVLMSSHMNNSEMLCHSVAGNIVIVSCHFSFSPAIASCSTAVICHCHVTRSAAAMYLIRVHVNTLQ